MAARSCLGIFNSPDETCLIPVSPSSAPAVFLAAGWSQCCCGRKIRRPRPRWILSPCHPCTVPYDPPQLLCLRTLRLVLVFPEILVSLNSSYFLWIIFSAYLAFPSLRFLSPITLFLPIRLLTCTLASLRLLLQLAAKLTFWLFYKSQGLVLSQSL